MKTIKQINNMKLKLEYGNPLISRLEQSEEKFYLNVVIPGVVDGEMVLVADKDKLMVEHEVDSTFIGKFKFFIYTDNVDFEKIVVEKQNGVLYLEAPVFQYSKDTVKTITV
jgi:HSP20 family molecular chaperone IbpA